MTVLDGVSFHDIIETPYPHVVIENAIDPSLCATLIREFPPLDLVVGPRAGEDNVKGNLTAHRALRDARVSATWQAFLRAHLTADFFWLLESLFHEHLLAAFPTIAPWLSPRVARIGIRRDDPPDRCDVMLDAIIGAQSPVRGVSRIERRPHIKGRNRLLVGFLYLKADDDTATGGDFEFYAPRGHTPPRVGIWRQARVDDVTRVKTVPYRNNTLVITMNSPQAFQALSARGPGSRPLMYMHFLAQTRRTLFDLDYSLPGRLHESAWRLIDPYK